MAHILLIEPNTILARVYGQALQHSGYGVSVVAGAQEAVAAADACTPDVVVMELQMPLHGGVEFLYEFRSYSEWQHIPVVLHTVAPGRILAPLQSTLKNTLGVRAFLYKPQTSLKQLVKTVQNVVETTS